jgi:hypothetical protein
MGQAAEIAVRQAHLGGRTNMTAQGESLRPTWDRNTRELRLEGRLCKRLAEMARAQITILDAFEEDGWPERIDDPLPGGPNRQQHLADAVRRLNKCAHIRFYRDRTGEGVRWKVHG